MLVEENYHVTPDSKRRSFKENVESPYEEIPSQEPFPEQLLTD